jgi:tRNA(fMet)-specific endonuclease VapC
VTAEHLVDTDIAIEALRKRDQELMAQMRAAGTVALSSISLYELRFGAERSADPERNHRAVDELVAATIVLPFDHVVAAEAGVIRAALAGAGTPIGPYDVLIAAHARVRDLTLVTRNVKEFRRVDGLRVIKW